MQHTIASVVLLVAVALGALVGAAPLGPGGAGLVGNATTPAPVVPQPHAWPEAFNCSFEAGNSSGVVFYDWTQRAQRIVHAAGSYECQHFYNQSACELIFPPNGTNMYAFFPATNTCCKDMVLSTLPPTWPQAGQPTFIGAAAVGGLFVDGWAYANGSHQYWELAGPPYSPVEFTFRNISAQTMLFRPSSMQTGAQAPALFQLPPNVSCAAACPAPPAAASSALRAWLAQGAALAL